MTNETRWPKLSKWFDKMLRAGWQYWAWVENDGDPNIMFRHLDDEACLTQRQARRYCLDGKIQPQTEGNAFKKAIEDLHHLYVGKDLSSVETGWRDFCYSRSLYFEDEPDGTSILQNPSRGKELLFIYTCIQNKEEAYDRG